MSLNPDNFHIGSGTLSVNGSDVGGTTPAGMTVMVTPDVHLHMSGQYGNTPVKASLIGRELKLKVVMAETVFNNIERAMAGALQEDSRIKFGGNAGEEVVGALLVLTPFDGTESWYFRNAVPTSSVEVAYGVEDERVLEVEFTAMIDTTAPEGEELAFVS